MPVRDLFNIKQALQSKQATCIAPKMPGLFISMACTILEAAASMPSTSPPSSSSSSSISPCTGPAPARKLLNAAEMRKKGQLSRCQRNQARYSPDVCCWPAKLKENCEVGPAAAEAPWLGMNAPNWAAGVFAGVSLLPATPESPRVRERAPPTPATRLPPRGRNYASMASARTDGSTGAIWQGALQCFLET